MYKVLIADDEKIIRMGLRGILDWEAYGFEIAGEAATGREVLTKMLEIKPDLVLIDIRMPGITGLEALGMARNGGFNGKVIVLSGYSDFQYAQEAIDVNVVSYLTKPVDLPKLEKTLIEIKIQLDQENTDNRTRDLYFKHAREKLLKDIMTGDIDIDDLEEKRNELGFEYGPYRVVMAEKYSLKQEDPEYSFSEILRLSESRLRREKKGKIEKSDTSFEEIIDDDGYVTILIKGKDAEDKLQEALVKFDMEMPPEKNSPLDSIFLAMGPKVEEAVSIPDSYEVASYYMKNRFFCDKGQHYVSPEHPPYGVEIRYGEIMDDENYMVDDSMSADTVREKLLEPYSNLLIESIQVFNRHKLAEGLRNLQEQLYLTNLTVEQIKDLLLDIYLKVKEKVMVLYNKAEIPFKADSETVAYIRNAYYLYEIITFISEQADMIITAIGGSSRDSILDDVVFYIEHNYAFNITLENLAPLFGYNSSYLGKIFSKRMGVNFNTYLDQIRIEHSKELLLSGKAQVYKVAEMVGYKNVDYFHIKFKKYVGISPAEYRKRGK
ncbi:MAG: response regulator [Eubacterium sp.]|nr:response regulator [Eubacterium sp.]